MNTESTLAAAEANPSPEESRTTGHRVCPWWMGYLFLNPLRTWLEKPDRLLRRYVKPGMHVLDVGCAMGFFSLPLAELVGTGGRVVCVDLQEKMIARLVGRARRAGVLDRIDARVCTADSLGLGDREGSFDVVLAYHVVHEVPDAGAHFRELHRAMKPGAVLLYVEPQGHVKKTEFARLCGLALAAGFTRDTDGAPALKRNHAVVLRRRTVA